MRSLRIRKLAYAESEAHGKMPKADLHPGWDGPCGVVVLVVRVCQVTDLVVCSHGVGQWVARVLVDTLSPVGQWVARVLVDTLSPVRYTPSATVHLNVPVTQMEVTVGSHRGCR